MPVDFTMIKHNRDVRKLAEEIFKRVAPLTIVSTARFKKFEEVLARNCYEYAEAFLSYKPTDGIGDKENG